MFFGNHYHTVDEKGRVSIPKEFRTIMEATFMEDRLMVTCYYDNRLRAFLPEVWKKMAVDVGQWDFRNQDNRDFEMFFLGGAHLCRMDRSGRILIPEELREYAGLNRDIVLVGQANGIDIWDKENYQKIWKRAIKKANDSSEFPANIKKDNTEES